MATWRSIPVALAAATILLTTACGGSGGEKQAGADTPPPSPVQQSPLASPSPVQNDDRDGAAEQMALVDDPKAGFLLTDQTGFVLYRFADDGPDATKSACEGDCAKTWPPVPAEGATLPPGLSPSLKGSIKRADGTDQLTVGGIPLYRYAKDSRPGQVSGDGVGNTWFAGLPEEQVPGLEEAATGLGAGGNDAGAAPSAVAEPGTGAGTGTAAPEAGAEDLAALPGLSVVDDPELGEIVVDAKGRTLYRFTKDTAWPMTTACTGACLDQWKPAAVIDKNDVEGIDPKLVIPFNRPDGKKQQTLDCWPLYWFTGDKPGEINGQGKGGTWFAVAPDGSLVKK
ncbi:SCO0930 family lipoprotein [Streptomyces sp. NPDC058417]|uniref:SCO0930 family lipoprotein n=1 Tax=unclassified Streptomyces TaxID=2593676 RepID=UPI003656EB9A